MNSRMPAHLVGILEKTEAHLVGMLEKHGLRNYKGIADFNLCGGF